MTFDPSWAPVVQDILARRAGESHVCYIALKGSRLNGVAGPDSDVDLRTIFLSPTTQFLGLRPPKHTYELMEVHGGQEVDFVAYEMGRFCHHLLNHNGNMIESLLVPDGFYWADEHGETLRRMGSRWLTKRLYKFYRGYAEGQFNRACSQVRTGKGFQSTYREMYMGLKVLLDGEMEFNLPRLADWVAEHVPVRASAVFPTLRRDREVLSDSIVRRISSEYGLLNAALDSAVMVSDLPADYNGFDALNTKLLKWRSQGWR